VRLFSVSAQTLTVSGCDDDQGVVIECLCAESIEQVPKGRISGGRRLLIGGLRERRLEVKVDPQEQRGGFVFRQPFHRRGSHLIGRLFD